MVIFDSSFIPSLTVFSDPNDTSSFLKNYLQKKREIEEEERKKKEEAEEKARIEVGFKTVKLKKMSCFLLHLQYFWVGR